MLHTKQGAKTPGPSSYTARAEVHGPLAESTSMLVRSKLVVPNSVGLLHRPRVCRILEKGSTKKLTLVSAPAGYGKTSILADFVHHSPLPTCWFTADERDRGLGAFVSYVIGAIRERYPGFGEQTQASLDTLSGDIFRDPGMIVGDLANEILAIDEHFALIWDNFEDIEGAFGLRGFIARLIEVLPSNCHIMIGSRVLPDVPVTRLVAQGQLVGLTIDDLRFAAPEIRELLSMSQIDVSPAESEVIAAGSEGWITGVLLLADLAHEEAGALLRGAGKASEETFDYLAAEVLDRQPDRIQDFLRRSAVLRDMSAQLCEDILQMPRSAAMLAEVERQNLFITRFGDETSGISRYHNLFRAFLVQQLREKDADTFADLNLRAARYFERTHNAEEAVYHYVCAKVFPDAVVLMDRLVMELFTRGRADTIVKWVQALPEDVRASAPWLSFYHSRVLTDRFDYAEAYKSLEYAENGFAALGDRGLLARIYNQRATIALFEGRYKDTLNQAQEALNLLAESELLEQAEARRLVGRAYVGLGRLAEGVRELKAALADFRKLSSPYDVVNLLQDLSLALTSQGRLDQVSVLLNEALSIARRLGALPQLAGILNNLANTYYCQGEYDRALPLYEEGLVAARRGGDPRWEAYISIGMADLYRDIRAYDEAERYYAAGWHLVSEGEPEIALYVLVAQADMARLRGDFSKCQSLLTRARALAKRKSPQGNWEGLLKMSSGALLIDSDDPTSGRKLLAEAVTLLEHSQVPSDLLRARFLLARAHLMVGDPEKAVTELGHVMDLSRQLKTMQFAYTEGDHAIDLLQLGLGAGLSECQAILDAIDTQRRLRTDLLAIGDDSGAQLPRRLEIFSFGEGHVVRDGQQISSSAWRAATARELFFFILVNGPVSRDAIGLVFWPDLPKKSVRDTFHATLYRVRRVVGHSVVKLTDGQYGIASSDYWFDAEEFERLVDRARLLPLQSWQTEDLWRRAVELYVGEFLPEVERIWVTPLRERYKGLYLDALIGLARCSETRHDYLEAIDRYQKALETDNLREDVYARLMECFAAVGRRSDALNQYNRCRAVFADELGIEPSPSLSVIYERIAGTTPD